MFEREFLFLTNDVKVRVEQAQASRETLTAKITRL